MAEKEQQPNAEQEKAKAEFEAMQKELGPLVQKLQQAQTPEERMPLIKRIKEILEKFKAMMGEEAFYQQEQLVQLENMVNQKEGALEG